MKWGTKYGADYVNKLYAMIKRNITLPFQLVCFTDDKSGINANVVIKELPRLDLPKGTPERGWTKLTTLKSNLGGLSGDALFLDLDIVIVSNIDCFFEFDADFAICFDEKKKASRIGNSSVYRFKIGAHEDILTYFQNNYDEVVSNFRNEQAFLSKKIDEKNMLRFWPSSWTPSFKYHSLPRFPFNFFQHPRIPKGAKIVLFHGKPEPYEAEKGISGKWYRYFRPALWISDHWKV